MRNLFILYTFAPALSRAPGARDVIFRERHAFFRFHHPSKTAFRSHGTKANLCHAPFGAQNSISQTADAELGKYRSNGKRLSARGKRSLRRRTRSLGSREAPSNAFRHAGSLLADGWTWSLRSTEAPANAFRHAGIHLAGSGREAWEVAKRRQTPFGARESVCSASIRG